MRVAADGGANRIYDVNHQLLAAKSKAYPDHTASADALASIQQSNGRDAPAAGENDDIKPDILTGLDAVVGDLDSLLPEVQQYWERKEDQSSNPGSTPSPPSDVKIVRDPDQYSTDFTKAVRWAREARPGGDVVAMGGLGGRVDQGLSQIHHLYMFQTSPTYADGRLMLVSGEGVTFLLKAGTHRIHVREGTGQRIADADAVPDGEGAEEQRGAKGSRLEGEWEEVFGKYVGILPVKEPSVISTKGLEWDVQDWPTEFGGQVSTSNHVLPETEVVEIKTTRDVVFTISLKER